MFDKITKSAKLMESSLNVDLALVIDHSVDDQFYLCQNMAVAELLVAVLRYLNKMAGTKDPVEIYMDREIANSDSFGPNDYITDKEIQRLATEAKRAANPDQVQEFFDSNEKYFDKVTYDVNGSEIEFEATSDEKQQWQDEAEAEQEREWHRRHPGN